jgi:hypothetical protein
MRLLQLATPCAPRRCAHSTLKPARGVGACDDERARAVERGLSGKEPDLDTVELALEGVVEGADPATGLGLLGELARLNAGDEQAATSSDPLG